MDRKMLHKILGLFFIFSFAYGQSIGQNKANLSENKKWDGIDTSKHTVPLKELMVYESGDYDFPVLNRKVFVDKYRGDKFLYVKEPVISIEMNGEAKAYPLSILRYYEILNDEVGGIPVLIAYCSLCNSAMVFDKRINFKGESYALDFLYPKMARQSNMVVKDKQTNTLWQQFDGKGLVGKLSGAELTQLSFVLMSYKDFFVNYPNGKILTPESDPKMQFYKGYMMNPDVGYADINSDPHFFLGKVDARLSPKELVLVLKLKDRFFVYPFSAMTKENMIQDKPSGSEVVIFYNPNMVSILDKELIKESKNIGYAIAYSPQVKGKRLKFAKAENGFIDTKTGSHWNMLGTCIDGKYKGEKLQPYIYTQTFAFAILAFHPEAVVYEKK